MNTTAQLNTVNNFRMSEFDAGIQAFITEYMFPAAWPVLCISPQETVKIKSTDFNFRVEQCKWEKSYVFLKNHDCVQFQLESLR